MQSDTSEALGDHRPNKHHVNTGRPANACTRCKSRKIRVGRRESSADNSVATTDRYVLLVRKHRFRAGIRRTTSRHGSESDGGWVDSRYVRMLESRVGALESSIAAWTGTNARKRPRVEGIEEGAFLVDLDHSELPSLARALDPLPSTLDSWRMCLDASTVESTQDACDAAAMPPGAEVLAAVEHFLAQVNPAYPILHEPTIRREVASLSSTISHQLAHNIYGACRVYSSNTSDHGNTRTV